MLAQYGEVLFVLLAPLTTDFTVQIVFRRHRRQMNISQCAVMMRYHQWFKISWYGINMYIIYQDRTVSNNSKVMIRVI